ncbi:hemerythrin domain-containing protein [Kitasatospora albolonga]|uniref:hemerythrin domain-containing protein n=1 Tax=Kitasatospora albolonga TaxID=68173 RepID=UPI0031EBE3C1
MCHYCGCREIPLIKEFIAEHESVTDLAGKAVRLLERGDLDGAGRLAARMAEELRAHWDGEERGLFRVMGGDPEYAAYVGALIAEHRELAAFLGRLDLHLPDQRAAFVAAAEELHHHIAKEEDGLFPAALTALTGDQWDTAMAAWQTVHRPDRPDHPDHPVIH